MNCVICAERANFIDISDLRAYCQAHKTEDAIHKDQTNMFTEIKHFHGEDIARAYIKRKERNNKVYVAFNDAEMLHVLLLAKRNNYQNDSHTLRFMVQESMRGYGKLAPEAVPGRMHKPDHLTPEEERMIVVNSDLYKKLLEQVGRPRPEPKPKPPKPEIQEPQYECTVCGRMSPRQHKCAVCNAEASIMEI